MPQIKADTSGLTDTRRIKAIRVGARGRLPRATKNALNWTAFDTRERVQKLMRRVFHEPTKFTLKGVLVDKATNRRLRSSVYLRDEATKGTPPAKYLQHQVRGTSRQPKRFEAALRSRGLIGSNQFVVPGPDAPLNKAGNVTGGRTQKILSALGGSRDAAQDSATSGGYFVMREAGPRHRGTLEGRGKAIAIAKRLKTKLKILFWVVDDAPDYSRRLRFDRFSRKTATKLFPARFDRALNRELRR